MATKKTTKTAKTYKTTEAQREATRQRMARMDSLTLWLTPEEKAQLREKAKEAGVSMTELIRRKVGLEKPDKSKEEAPVEAPAAVEPKPKRGRKKAEKTV